MSEFFELLDGLNKYSSLVLMLATLVYVYFTYKLTKETTKLREVETSPFINVKLVPEQGFSKIFVENIGNAPAYKLTIKFEEEAFKSIKSDLYKTYMSEISYFGVGQVLDITLRTEKLLESEEDIVLNLIYYSNDNRKFNEIIHLNFKAEKNLGVAYPKKEYESELKILTKEIEKVGKNIETLACDLKGTL